MDSESENQITADVAHVLLETVAPQELPLFKANSEAYFRDPKRAFSRRQGKDQVLGFGLAPAAAFLTPGVLSVTSVVIAYLFTQVKLACETESTNVINEMVKNLFGIFRPPEVKPVIVLTEDQLNEIHKIMMKEAAIHKLSEQHARDLADATVSELARGRK